MVAIPQDGPRQMGMASAWRGELWQALRVNPSPPKNARASWFLLVIFRFDFAIVLPFFFFENCKVLALFWQRVVLRHVFATSSSVEKDRVPRNQQFTLGIGWKLR